MLDINGYPDDKSLERIATWDILQQGVPGLLDLVRENTQWADRQMGISGNDLEYHTGGWSGNEDVIGALRHNYLFWSLFWLKSKSGGHYYFEIPNGFLKRERPE